MARGRGCLHWYIGAAAVVVLGSMGLILVSLYRPTTSPKLKTPGLGVSVDGPFTASEILKRIGPPDHKVRISDALGFFAGQPGCDAPWVARTMDSIYHRFEPRQERQSSTTVSSTQPADWQADDSFLACTLWLYSWNHPQEVVAPGIILSKRLPGRDSSYFLMQDELAITHGHMTRMLPDEK